MREIHDILFEKAVEGMTAEEVLNYYRNLYHAEPQSTEHGIIANALNDVLPRMILPPCKVGDVVYSPRENGVLEQNVISIEIEKDPHVRVYFTCDYLCDGCPHKRTYQNQDGDGGCWGEYGESFFAFEDFGRTVFLTREEAEHALKGEHHAEVH